MSQGTPPERPGGRASADRNSFLGFSGRSEEKRAGAVVEYLGRTLADIGGTSERETVLGEG